MPQDLIQNCVWPGVIGVANAEYVCSHGITPGRFTIQTFPQRAAPLEFGDLTFTDGKQDITIPDCKVISVEPIYSSSAGITYSIEGVDRRWRWQFGAISGGYNEKDDRGKLVPWTIRSPNELAALLLAQMGEVNPRVILPAGLPRQAGLNLERYLRLGENYPQTLTNPEQVWDHSNPAQALARLVEQWGCRVIYQPGFDRVLICPLGKGVPFPDLPCEVISANVTGGAPPAYVAAFSKEPIKFQMRFRLEPVGRDWHGAYLPIDELSYAPVVGAKPQITMLLAFKDSGSLPAGLIIAYRTAGGDEVEGYFTASPGGTNINKFNAIANGINTHPVIGKVILAIVQDANTVILKAKLAKQPFTALVRSPDFGPSWFVAKLAQAAGNVNNTWASCPPPQFLGVQATDRLDIQTAQGLAQDTVWKCFRILNQDAHDKFAIPGKGRPIEVPWLGNKIIKRRQQIVLTDTKVYQVIPLPRIPGAINKGNLAGNLDPNAPNFIPGGGVLPEFYNGYSRAQAATVTGSVWKKLGGSGVWYWVPANANGDTQNTDTEDRVFIDFSVNPTEQLIKFSDYVFKYAPGAGAMAWVEKPVLTLETGVYLKDAETNQFLKWEEALKIVNGSGPWEWFELEDMHVGVIGIYGIDNKLIDKDFDGVQDAVQRAGYYLRGKGTQYQIKGGEVRQYIGLVPINPDGYCQQVSFSVGDGGATTKVSGNTEFHPTIAQYPARRRAENLPANQAAALVNRKEREVLDIFGAAPRG